MPLANDVLSQIPSESLLELISSVRYEISPPGSTGIPALDAHFFSTKSTSLSSSLNRGDVIEIQGASCSGKTQLLYFLLSTCILPYQRGSVKFEGWGKVAIVFDVDGTFDIRRLYQILLSRLRCLVSWDDHQIQSLTESCLKRIHISRPTSTTQLAVTLAHLPEYLASNWPDAEMGLIAIDSVSSFYWQDRFTVEQIRLGPMGMTGSVKPLQNVLSALQILRRSYGPVLVLTNWGLHPSDPSISNQTLDSPFYMQHLDHFIIPLYALQTEHRGSVDRIPTSGAQLMPLLLAHHITLQAATPDMHDGESRPNQITGVVRTPGNSRVDKFTFSVNVQGLCFE